MPPTGAIHEHPLPADAVEAVARQLMIAIGSRPCARQYSRRAARVLVLDQGVEPEDDAVVARLGRVAIGDRTRRFR